jgi:hypothetical protein
MLNRSASKMKRISIQSTTIESIGYDSGPQVLEIKFISGKIYRFYHVPQKVVNAFMAAPSKGQFFGREIRGKYEHDIVKEGARVVAHPGKRLDARSRRR